MNSKSNVPASKDSLQAVVRRWRVKGICLVPTEIEIEVEAVTAKNAVSAALKMKWQDRIGSNSGDSTSAFDWQPVAEEIEAPNDPSSATTRANQTQPEKMQP